ncbi:hypothetical protein PV328_011811 [Microctonus aethiopoides]|uniref:Uncharacterized protein n=1 Tax=Microctonus aethiopoides TaxID=144406 RepID=A0AA39EX77_9HYME|nr:hypothetical protein PV328_011811 [Microctonus aethiopoides]
MRISTNMTQKRRSKCAARKYNLKVLKRYRSLYPHDTYFASLPASCLHQEENGLLDGVSNSSTTNNKNATLELSPLTCIQSINTNFGSFQPAIDTINEDIIVSNHGTTDVNDIADNN